MIRGRALAAIVSACAVLVLPALAGADSAAPDKTRAQELFDEALRLMDAGEAKAACAKFRESLAAESSVGTLLNVAECDANEGNLVDAARAYRSARELNVSTPEEKRRRVIDERVAEALRALAPKLGTLRVIVSPPAAKAVVRLAGGKGGPLRAEGQEVAAGEQTVTVEAPDFQPGSGSTTVPGGGEAEIRVVLTPLAGEPKPKGDVSHGPSSLLIAGIALGAAGLAGLGAGGALLGLAASRSSDIEALCGPDVAPPACPAGDAAAANALVDEGQGFATGSYVAFAAGGALAATGLVLVLVDATSGGADERSEGKPRAKLSPTLGGLVLEGSF